jgi:hypothetical protein
MTATSSSAAGPLMNEYQLKVGNELRLEVGREEVALELLSGTAEVFGTPLSLHKRYTLPPGSHYAYFKKDKFQVKTLISSLLEFINVKDL